MTLPASTTQPRNVMACPVCKLRMDLLSRQGEHVSVACNECHISMTLPAAIWEIANAELSSDAR
jgi:hypothetical protein